MSCNLCNFYNTKIYRPNDCVCIKCGNRIVEKRLVNRCNCSLSYDTTGSTTLPEILTGRYRCLDFKECWIKDIIN